MVLTPTENNFGEAMCYTFGNLAKFLNSQNGKINQIFGDRYSPSVVNDEFYLENVIRYLYQNPVRANIVNRADQYRFSSLGFYLGYKNDGLMLSPDPFTRSLFDDGLVGLSLFQELVFQKLSDVDSILMQQSLRRYRFKFSREQIQRLRGQKTSLRL
jgi:hypothetical protein